MRNDGRRISSPIGAAHGRNDKPVQCRHLFHPLGGEPINYIGRKMENLSDLIDDLYSSVGVDLEGDSTYRVHVKKAEKLIIMAYNKGKDENNGK